MSCSCLGYYTKELFTAAQDPQCSEESAAQRRSAPHVSSTHILDIKFHFESLKKSTLIDLLFNIVKLQQKMVWHFIPCIHEVKLKELTTLKILTQIKYF